MPRSITGSARVAGRARRRRARCAAVWRAWPCMHLLISRLRAACRALHRARRGRPGRRARRVAR
eukprot:3984491-Prymnesium_polylepis.1